MGVGTGMSKSALDILKKIGVSEKVKQNEASLNMLAWMMKTLIFIRELPVELDSAAYTGSPGREFRWKYSIRQSAFNQTN